MSTLNDVADELNWTGILRYVTYGLIFEPDPSSRVDDAFNWIMHDFKSVATPTVFLRAIRIALASNVDLAEEWTQTSSDAQVRRFLRALEIKLAASLAPS